MNAKDPFSVTRPRNAENQKTVVDSLKGKVVDGMLTLLLSKSGQVATFAATWVVGFALTFLAKYGIDLTVQDQAVVASFIALVVNNGLTFIITKFQAEQAAKVQTIIGAKPDGEIREKTIAQAERVAAYAQSNVAIPEGIAVPKAVAVEEGEKE